RNDHPGPLLYVRQGGWQQVGKVPRAAREGPGRRRGPGRAGSEALLLPAHDPHPRRPHREAPPVQPAGPEQQRGI
ncbi:hypothetical protein IWQ56_003095, partial [Coemansia nantahalensis]